MEVHVPTARARGVDDVLRAAADLLGALSVLARDPAEIVASLPELRRLRSGLSDAADVALREEAVEQFVDRLAADGRLERWERVLVDGVARALGLSATDPGRPWSSRYAAACARAGALPSLDWPGASLALRRPWESLHLTARARRPGAAEDGILFVTSQRIVFVDCAGQIDVAYCGLREMHRDGPAGVVMGGDNGSLRLEADDADLAEAHVRAAWDAFRGVERPEAPVPAMPPADDALERLFSDAGTLLEWTLQDVNTARLMWHATGFEPELLRVQLG